MKLFSMHLLQNIVLFSMHKYSNGATDSERKLGTTNYRKMNRQKKKKAFFSSSIMGKGPKGGLRPM